MGVGKWPWNGPAFSQCFVRSSWQTKQTKQMRKVSYYERSLEWIFVVHIWVLFIFILWTTIIQTILVFGILFSTNKREYPLFLLNWKCCVYVCVFVCMYVRLCLKCNNLYRKFKRKQSKFSVCPVKCFFAKL